MVKLPRIAITMGDPAGIGPELCLRLLRHPDVNAICWPAVIGDARVLERVAGELNWPQWRTIASREAWRANWQTITGPVLIDLEAIRASEVQPGVVSATCGQAAYDYVTFAIDEALAGRVD